MAGLPLFFQMNIFLIIAGATAFIFLTASCKNSEENGSGDSGETGKAVVAEPSGRGQGEGRARTAPAPKSQVGAINDKLRRLSKMRGPEGKRDLFAEILMELPPDEHDLAVSAVVDDLNSPQPANLVSEYLEMSAFLSPVLQLPGIVRLLEEPALPQIQRIVMEQQLREELQLSPDEEVADWRPLVEEHLKELPGIMVD